jgi:hypothetical protein
VKIAVERLHERLELELERDNLERGANEARQRVESLLFKAQGLEAKAQEDRYEKVAQFNQRYTELLRATLKDVRHARLDADYEPVLNDYEYREASSAVARRLMYFVAFLQMSLADPAIPFPRFLLVDTPDTAGIDQENLSKAIGAIPRVLEQSSMPAQVILTTGPQRYPQELQNLRVITLTEADRLLKRKTEADSNQAKDSSEEATGDVEAVDYEEAVIQALDALASELVDSDEQITGLIAETNASGYYHDDMHVIDVGPYDPSSSKLPFKASIHFSGDQDPEKMFSGDAIVAEVSGTLSFDGTHWELDDNYNVVAEIEPYGDEDEEE